MRFLGAAVAGVLALTAPIAADAGAATLASSAGPVNTGRAPAIVQVWDGNGPGWHHTAPGGWGGGWHPNPGHSGQWGGNWARSHWAPNRYFGFWGPPEAWGGHTLYGEAPTFPTAATVTGARCGIPTQNGEARTEAGVIPSRQHRRP
jgi:hypothetical protein